MMDPGLAYALVAFTTVWVVLAGYGVYLLRRAHAAQVDETADKVAPPGSEDEAHRPL